MAEGDRAPLAFLVVDPGTSRERSVPIHDRLVVGRRGGDPADAIGKLMIDDDGVSRMHLEIRLHAEEDQAWVVDLSRNGTRVNGSRIERSVPVRLRPGDRLGVGPAELEFRSARFAAASDHDPFRTAKQLKTAPMVLVVGDVVSFSTISQYTDDEVLLRCIGTVYSELRDSLARHYGIVSNFVGDAFFASWELPSRPDAAEHAVSFALESNERVREIGPALELRDPSGDPIRMGWGISLGSAASTSATGRGTTVLGDATNLAFRLSGIAGRGGWPDVIVTEEVRGAISSSFSLSEPHEVEVRGRVGKVAVYGVERLGQPGPPP